VILENKNIQIHSTDPGVFPPSWAAEWGEDRHGLWAAFIYKNIRQVLRWIRPGCFMMGSPGAEPERDDDEVFHKVVLTRGYWLAETACTQELWQAVTGENTSRFKGKQNPVDSVSWDDCAGFLEQLNAICPGLNFRLPKEAEWEYACRSGTSTPFSFGENITTGQANFDGNYPYGSGPKGEYRNQTVEVKFFPCNPWGLYEMHGNVWEWCSDWYGDYDPDKGTDPKGPERGEDRVLRGGCWISFGRDVRSACRYRDSPDDRSGFIGLRLAQGH